MTLYEAKGLEFNDVLLYDFFADSMAALSEWRVVLNEIDDNKRGHISAPRFDESRHALLCSEVSYDLLPFRLFYLKITSLSAEIVIRRHHACPFPCLDFRHLKERGAHARENKYILLPDEVHLTRS